jgi:integrase
MASPTHSSPTLLVREYNGQPFYETKFRHDGRQVMRRVGPAWLDRDKSGEWVRRRGRLNEGFYDEHRANVRAAELVASYIDDAADVARVERERRARGVTFREVAHEYMRWLEEVKGAKPSTLVGHWAVLSESGVPYKRGTGLTLGHVMQHLGDKPAKSITVRDVEKLLSSVAATGVKARTVNMTRSVVSAVFNYGMKDSTFELPANPARGADKRQEPVPGVLHYYRPEEVEALARAFENGSHREVQVHNHRSRCGHSRGVKCRCVVRYAAHGRMFSDLAHAEAYLKTGRSEDQRQTDYELGALARVAAYTGLRMGELRALRWRDIDFAGSALLVSRAMSADVETSTKSRRPRQVALPDQAAAALERVSRRQNFTGHDELVFPNEVGRPLTPSWVRQRFLRARDAAGLRPLRFHDLRHTYGSLLAAGGVDVVTIKEAMGHSALTTTARYLHARPAHEQAAVFTRVFASSAAPELVGAE